MEQKAVSSISRAIPWVVVGLLTAALAGTWFGMNIQLQERDTELAVLRGKFDQLSADSTKRLDEANKRIKELATDSAQRLAAANDQIEAAKQTIDTTNEKLEQASQRETEASVTFRKAILNSGKVAGIKSTATEATPIDVLVRRPSSGASKHFELTLDPGQVKEIGAVEGWAFVAGDTIEITQPAHKARTFTAP